MKKILSILIAIGLLLSFTYSSSVADDRIEANQVTSTGTSGSLNISLKIPEISDDIQAFKYEHQVITAREAGSGMATGKREAGSGLATGKRTHSPITIHKRIDKASPLLMKSLVTNSTLSRIEIAVNEEGAKSPLYSIVLSDASISSIKQSVDTDDNGSTHEEITITYQKIEWIWVDGNIRTSDVWN